MKENTGIDNFDPTFILHQKEWAKFIFDHVNPYTGLAYKDEPAVLSWEISNECSLAVAWFLWDLWGKMTPPFKAELTRQFDDWLRTKYGTTEKVREAWRSSSPAKQPVNGGTLDYGAGYPQTYADFLDIHFYYGGSWVSPARPGVRRIGMKTTSRW